MNLKYFIKTFGCQMNKSDSEKIDHILQKNGYQKASRLSGADLIIVNMCSVRQSAVDRVFGLTPKLDELREKNPHLKTVLTGCILKHEKKKFNKFFDFVLPIKTLRYWPQLLEKEEYFFHPDQRKASFTHEFGIDYLEIPSQSRRIFSAFVPISSGCNNFCTYCVVPYTRGPLVCRPHEKIIEQTKSWIEKGVKEIWLLGQNVNDYSSPSDSDIKFPELLQLVNGLPGDFWLRFHSPNPKDFSNKMIQKIKDCEKVTEYLNLPVQSGDNEVLKRMNRPYTVQEYKELARKIRKEVPDIALSTDVIVGFPGETKKQFQNTVKLFKEIGFDMAYIAEYSVRPGTKATQWEDNVSPEEKARRRELLTKILKKTALENNKKLVGKSISVLVEEKGEKDNQTFFLGKSRQYKTVKIVVPYPHQDIKGKIIKTKITKALPLGLRGELINT